MQIDYSINDLNELDRVAMLIKGIDQISAAEAERMMDEMCLQQPFFLSVLLGYRFDTSPGEFNELITIFLLIWAYFRQCENIKTHKLTQAYFEDVQLRHLQMLKYAEQESNEEDRQFVFKSNLDRLKSKVLYAVVHMRIIESVEFYKMKSEDKGLILIGIKSLVECFETI
jgi:hypothetical protein